MKLDTRFLTRRAATFPIAEARAILDSPRDWLAGDLEKQVLAVAAIRREERELDEVIREHEARGNALAAKALRGELHELQAQSEEFCNTIAGRFQRDPSPPNPVGQAWTDSAVNRVLPEGWQDQDRKPLSTLAANVKRHRDAQRARTDFVAGNFGHGSAAHLLENRYLHALSGQYEEVAALLKERNREHLNTRLAEARESAPARLKEANERAAKLPFIKSGTERLAEIAEIDKLRSTPPILYDANGAIIEHEAA